MNNEIEIWKDIPEYECLYQCSSFGRIKSLTRLCYGRKRKERILKPSNDGRGYLQVVLSKQCKETTYKVHKLIAISFLNHESSNSTIIIDHINNVRHDNNVKNLQIITQRENASKDKKGFSSKYVGVSWSKAAKKWEARIRLKNKSIYLGLFNCEIDASKSYQNKLKESNNE